MMTREDYIRQSAEAAKRAIRAAVAAERFRSVGQHRLADLLVQAQEVNEKFGQELTRAALNDSDPAELMRSLLAARDLAAEAKRLDGLINKEMP